MLFIDELREASESGDIEKVKYLIEQCNADVSTKNDYVSSDDMSIYYNSIITITDMDVMIIYRME